MRTKFMDPVWLTKPWRSYRQLSGLGTVPFLLLLLQLLLLLLLLLGATKDEMSKSCRTN